MIKGYLVVMNGNCKSDLEGIFTVFIPTTDKRKAVKYVAGNGDIISAVPYNVNLECLSQYEKNLIIERMAYLQE